MMKKREIELMNINSGENDDIEWWYWMMILNDDIEWWKERNGNIGWWKREK